MANKNCGQLYFISGGGEVKVMKNNELQKLNENEVPPDVQEMMREEKEYVARLQKDIETYQASISAESLKTVEDESEMKGIPFDQLPEEIQLDKLRSIVKNK
ncbi:MAG TPA: hypothetical protein VIY47_01260 [Ignavibacteriaceae bacterium]